jgi:hypothetical protein
LKKKQKQYTPHAERGSAERIAHRALAVRSVQQCDTTLPAAAAALQFKQQPSL